MENDINCAYFCLWIYLILIKVLHWRLRDFEGEVIGEEECGHKEKKNVIAPPLADKSFVKSQAFFIPDF